MTPTQKLVELTTQYESLDTFASNTFNTPCLVDNHGEVYFTQLDKFANDKHKNHLIETINKKQAEIDARAERLKQGPNGYELMSALRSDMMNTICVPRNIAISDGETIKQGLPSSWFDGRQTDADKQYISLSDLEARVEGREIEPVEDEELYLV